MYSELLATSTVLTSCMPDVVVGVWGEKLVTEAAGIQIQQRQGRLYVTSSEESPHIIILLPCLYCKTSPSKIIVMCLSDG